MTVSHVFDRYENAILDATELLLDLAYEEHRDKTPFRTDARINVEALTDQLMHGRQFEVLLKSDDNRWIEMEMSYWPKEKLREKIESTLVILR